MLNYSIKINSFKKEGTEVFYLITQSIPNIIHHWLYMNKISVWSNGELVLTRADKELREKTVPVPLYPRKIPHGLDWDRNWASMVKDQ